jgi:iron complex transport system substrate-binding protein
VNKIVPGLIAGLLLLAACGSSSDSRTGAAGAPSSTTPSPRRIVSLSATATEMLFAVGAGKQVVAVDDQSNYPAAAPKTNLSALTPNIEAIANHKPDLVVIAGDTKGLKAGLEQLGMRVLDQPAAATIDDTYREILELGQATGHRGEAEQENASIKRGIADAVKGLPNRAKPLTYYYELDNTLFSVTSKTFIGSLFTRAGLRNVADAADAGGTSGGYPQLSAEYLVQANPDFVFLADTKCCQQSRTTFAARPGFAGLHAVTAGRVVQLDDDIASRWGPRVVELLKAIVTAVKKVSTS